VSVAAGGRLEELGARLALPQRGRVIRRTREARLSAGGEAVRIPYTEPHQQFTEPDTPFLLVGKDNVVGGVLRVAQLGDGVHERTAAKPFSRECALESSKAARICSAANMSDGL